MEAGNENMNPKFKLPVHKPDPDLWNRIETEMDYQEMVEATNMNTREMPVHSPAERVWQAIEARLPFIPYYRRSYFRVSMVVLAIFLVSFLGWIISQLIIDISPQAAPPTENTTIQPVASPDETATSYHHVEADASLKEQGVKEEIAATRNIYTQPIVNQEYSVAAESPPMTAEAAKKSLEEELFPLAREKPDPYRESRGHIPEMTSYRLSKPTSSTLMVDGDEYYMPKRKKGHITLGAYTMPEYMHFSEGAPDNSALSSDYGMSFKYNWGTYFFESGLGYRQFTANSLYGINFSDLNLLGSVLLVSEYQIVQYYNDEGELVIEKILKPTFVQIYDTSTVVVEEETQQRYSFVDIPLYFGKVVWSKNRYALAVKAGTRFNFPLKNTENTPTPPPQDADLVTVEPIAILASKFFVQFNLSLENRIHFSDRGYISFDPMFGYHRQSIQYFNEVKRQSSFSAGLRVGIYYQLK
jgi:hypothetical protein